MPDRAEIELIIKSKGTASTGWKIRTGVLLDVGAYQKRDLDAAQSPPKELYLHVFFYQGAGRVGLMGYQIPGVEVRLMTTMTCSEA